MAPGPGHGRRSAVGRSRSCCRCSPGEWSLTGPDFRAISISIDVYARAHATGSASAGRTAEPIDPNGPSVFTALQEQLGVEARIGAGPVEVLVIDHVERPTPD